MGNEKQGREKRKHERFALWFPILVDSLSDGRSDAVVVDASAGGLLIHKKHKLHVGETVSVTIALPGQEKKFVLGRIRRVEHGEHGHRVAISFVGEAPELAAIFERARTNDRSKTTKAGAKAGELLAWRPLTEWTEATLSHGTVLRCQNARRPYESTVDFMLIDHRLAPSGCALMVSTGYKAGSTFFVLPADAGSGGGLSTRWLIEHWEDSVYPGCPVTSVLVLRHYPAAVSIERDAPERSLTSNV